MQKKPASASSDEAEVGVRHALVLLELGMSSCTDAAKPEWETFKAVVEDANFRSVVMLD